MCGTPHVADLSPPNQIVEGFQRFFLVCSRVGPVHLVDIYVVTILVALVNLGSLATIKAGPGAAFFAAVVVITMFAAMSFDPRLIWDVKETVDE